MRRPSAGATLSVAVAAVIVSGVASLAVPSSAFTTIGVLLVIVGLMGLIPVVRLGLADDTSEVLGFR